MNCLPWLQAKLRKRKFYKIQPEEEPEPVPEPVPEPEPILMFDEELTKFSIGELSGSDSDSDITV